MIIMLILIIEKMFKNSNNVAFVMCLYVLIPTVLLLM